MNNPIDFFRSLFKNKKTTLTGREAIALQYLHPEKGAINTGDYCTTQDIANLSPPYTPPIGLTKQYDLRTSGFDEISNDTGVAIINGTSGPGPYYIYLPSSPYEGMEFYMCSNVSTAYGVSTPSSDAIISYTDLTNKINLITVNQLETLRFKYTGGIWVVSKIQNYTITSDTVVTDEITEKNAGVGVTIDGVLLKDGKVDPESINPIAYYSVTATGNNAAGAKLLKYGFNQITTAFSSSMCVALPTEITNQKLYVNNYTSEIIYVFGNQAGEFIIQDITNNAPNNFNNITINPFMTVEFVRIGSVWVAVSFSGVANKPLIYKAILTQSGTNAPVATVLNGNDANYLSGVTFSRDSAGTYYILRTGFSATNTLVHFDRATNKLSTHSLTSGTNYILYEQYELSGGTATKFEGITMGFITIEYYGA